MNEYFKEWIQKNIMVYNDGEKETKLVSIDAIEKEKYFILHPTEINLRALLKQEGFRKQVEKLLADFVYSNVDLLDMEIKAEQYIQNKLKEEEKHGSKEGNNKLESNKKRNGSRH